jgi:N-acyl homoserine lactone hydrolase
MLKKLIGLGTLSIVLAAGMVTSTGAKDIKLYQVTSGYLELDKGWLTAMSDVGKRITIPVAMHIIEHPRGLVVFDTGMADDVAGDGCAAYWGKGLCGAFTLKMKREEVIDKQLEKLGYSVDQVKYVIYSHMHLDHAGNMELFPKATHVLQKDELKAGWWPEKFQRAAFVLKDYDEARDYKFMELVGDFDLFGDGKVVVLDTKGHTQGHQSVLVRLPKTGTVILAADAVYTPENEAGVIPGITWNTNASMRFVQLRTRMLQRGSSLLYGADDRRRRPPVTGPNRSHGFRKEADVIRTP